MQKMIELKTLKDIEDCKDCMNAHRPKCANRTYLRKEAIEWIRHWDKSFEKVGDAEHYMMKQAKIRWAKHFFNITEDDLK